MTLYHQLLRPAEIPHGPAGLALLAKLGDYEELRLYGRAAEALDEKKAGGAETLLAQGEFSQEQFRYAKAVCSGGQETLWRRPSGICPSRRS